MTLVALAVAAVFLGRIVGAGGKYHVKASHDWGFRYDWDAESQSGESRFVLPCGRVTSTSAGFFTAYIVYTKLSGCKGCVKEFCAYNTGMADKVGRPARDPKSGAAKIVPIRMSDAEKAAYQKAAKRSKQTLSEWIRDQLDKAAGRST